MKKQLEFGGIRKVQTNLDYTQGELSTVTVTFAIIGHDLDASQRELIEVIQKAIEQHCALTQAQFDHYDKMLDGLKGFDWSKAYVPSSHLGFDAFADIRNEVSK